MFKFISKKNPHRREVGKNCYEKVFKRLPEKEA
jgi:hypothetical protein